VDLDPRNITIEFKGMAGTEMIYRLGVESVLAREQLLVRADLDDLALPAVAPGQDDIRGLERKVRTICSARGQG
jgi:hypothetical protein